MEIRNWIGIIMIVLGTSLQVYGYYSETWIRVISFILIILGVFVFATQRYIASKEASEFHYGPSNKNTSLPLMGDIFNTSGQRTGGRTDNSWSNDSSGSDGGGGGD